MSRGRILKAAGGVLAAAGLSGCLVTQQEIEDLRMDIVRLQNTLAKVQQNQSASQSSLQGTQADVLSQMNTLSRNIEVLSSNLEESQNRMSLLSTRLDDLDKNLSNRLDALVEATTNGKSSTPPSPSSLYNLAYGDFSRRRYDVALQGFKNYLERYGDTEKAADAQYYIGQCLTAKGDSAEAVQAYDAVLSKYPKSPVVPAAYLAKAEALEKLGKTSDALSIYDSIVKKYPHRKEAQAAQGRIAALKGGPSEPAR